MRKILKSLNSSQLFSSPDFPENCKWTKRGKLGSCFDYQMTGTVQGLCPARLCPDHISPPWLQLLSRFALLCSTLNFAGPQRNWAFAFYICFVQMSVDFFPCGLGLIRACMHISSTDKKLPSCMLTALPANSCMMSITFNVSICEKLSLLFYLPAIYNNLIFICCGFSVELVSDTNMLLILHNQHMQP